MYWVNDFETGRLTGQRLLLGRNLDELVGHSCARRDGHSLGERDVRIGEVRDHDIKLHNPYNIHHIMRGHCQVVSNDGVMRCCEHKAVPLDCYRIGAHESGGTCRFRATRKKTFSWTPGSLAVYVTTVRDTLNDAKIPNGLECCGTTRVSAGKIAFTSISMKDDHRRG